MFSDSNLFIFKIFLVLQVILRSVSSSSVGLGDSCSRDEECLVNNSRCYQGLCQCLPYYAVYNNTQCLQSTLLGFDCLVNEQCSQKVANSACIGGYCRCEQGFLQFRRHTCLTPAKVGDVCYGDSHCRLWDSGTHCDFLIPKLFGRCICTSPLKLSAAGTCLPPRPLRTPPPTSRPRPAGHRPFGAANRPFSNHQFSHKNHQQFNLMRKPPLSQNVHYKQNQTSSSIFHSQKVPSFNTVVEPTTISYTKPIVTTPKPPNTSVKVTSTSTSTSTSSNEVVSSKSPSISFNQQPIKHTEDNSIVPNTNKQPPNTKNSISYVQDLLVSSSIGVATDASLVSSPPSTLKAPVKYSAGGTNQLNTKPITPISGNHSHQSMLIASYSFDKSTVVATTPRNRVKPKPPQTSWKSSNNTLKPMQNSNKFSGSTNSFRPTKLPFLPTTVESASTSSGIRRTSTVISTTASPLYSLKPTKLPFVSTTHRAFANLMSKRPLLNKWQGLKRPGFNKLGSSSIKSNAVSSTTTALPVTTETAIRNRWDEAKVVSLGLPCTSDKQCKEADPASKCLRGVCDCANQTNKNSSTACSATNTGCFPGTFQCISSGQCISWYFVCDGRRDCSDGSDEACVGVRVCPRTAFNCSQSPSNVCVSAAARCNGVNECPNGEDEANCNDKTNIECPENTFRCGSGECLAAYEFCNAVISCKDGSDEGTACSAISHSSPSSSSSSSSSSSLLPSSTCPFRCNNGRCRSTAVTCSGRDGCGDNSDETSCSVCKCPAL